jgi:hypothetical protein
MSFLEKVGYPIFVSVAAALITGGIVALVSLIPAGSIAQFLGDLNIWKVRTAVTETNDAGIGEPPDRIYRCAFPSTLLQCSVSLVPTGTLTCDAAIYEDDTGGKCVVGRCSGVPEQHWRVSLTCLRR